MRSRSFVALASVVVGLVASAASGLRASDWAEQRRTALRAEGTAYSAPAPAAAAVPAPDPYARAPRRLDVVGANLQADSPVQLALDEELRSGRCLRYSLFELSVLRDVTDNLGRVLIARDTKAYGRVMNTRGAGGFGRSGKLGIRLEYTTAVDGQQVRLSGEQLGRGADRQGAVVATAVLIAPIAGLMRGKNTVLRPGHQFRAYVYDDYAVDPSANPRLGAAAPPAVVPPASRLQVAPSPQWAGEEAVGDSAEDQEIARLKKRIEIRRLRRELHAMEADAGE